MRPWVVAVSAALCSCARPPLTPDLTHPDAFCFGVTFGAWTPALVDVHHWGADTAYATGRTRFFGFTPKSADVSIGLGTQSGLVGWELGGRSPFPGLWHRLEGDTLVFIDGEPFEQLTLRFNPGAAERTGFARFGTDDGPEAVAPFAGRRAPCDSVLQPGRRDDPGDR